MRVRPSPGETGEAPPAAEAASLFRGSGTIGGPNGAGNRIAATVGCTHPGAGSAMKIAALHPPFSLGLAQRKRAVHGPKERRFWPLYTKADGRFLRHCRPGPEIFCRVRCPFYVNRYCSAANWSLGSQRGAEPKGPCVLAPGVPLPRKGDATSVRRQSRQRLSSRYALPG